MSAGGVRAHWTKVQYIVHWGLVKFILSLRYPIAGVIVSTSQGSGILVGPELLQSSPARESCSPDLAEVARGAFVIITRIKS